jgi:magnesium transporter
MLHNDERRTVVNSLIELLRVEADRLALKQKLKEFHSADIAEALEDISEETKRTIMESLDVEQRVEILEEASEQDIDTFVEDAHVSDLVELVGAMSVDDATEILDRVDEDKAQAVMNRLDPDHAEDLRELREYKPETAGRIMTTEFFWAKPEEDCAAVLERLKEKHEELETSREIFVCREDMKLKGMVDVEDILRAEPGHKIGELVDTATITIGPTVDQEIAARYMQKYDLSVLPVIDPGRRMLGIITFDDILEVMSDEASEDMYRMAGVGDKKPLEHGAFERAYKRLPWLVTTLVGSGFISPLIMNHLYHGTLTRFVALAFFIPAIAGLGGNAATQSSTITVRGLGTGEIVWSDLWWLLKREMSVALIISISCAIALGFFSYIIFSLGLQQSGDLSVVKIAGCISFSILCGTITAVCLGTCIPMVCHRVGVDPAIAAGPFITTLIDFSSQLIYLTIATYVVLG